MKIFKENKKLLLNSFVLSCAFGICTQGVMALGGDDDDGHDHEGHAGDIYVYVDDEGHIGTGLIDEDGDITLEVHVFEAEFGGEGLPGYTDEPGFDSAPDTFSPKTLVGLNALEGLHRWTGDGFDHAHEEELIVGFKTESFVIGEEGAEGFKLAVAPDGSFHRHFSFLLSASDESDTGEPTPGIYYAELEMEAEAGYEHSEPFWIVFNYQSSEEDHEAAVEWVAENLADEDHDHDDHDECSGDLDGDHDVDVNDLLELISQWGECH